MDTPICDFVRAYAAQAPLRFHMPGHKGTELLGAEALDITEIPGADVLYAPRGVIAQSEENAATLFGSARTVYSTEGSSLCVRAMLYLALLWAKEQGREPLVLAGRNAHRSFLSALALLDMDAVWLRPPDAGLLSCPVDAALLERRLSELPTSPAAVYLTSPDYLGGCVDIAEIAVVCHAHDTLLLVDNAHGAYLRFLAPSRHPIDGGADLCCDSAHKTLDALTGGAYLHVAKSAPPELCEAADRAMALFAGTSPSYLILQSLDAVNAVLADGFTEAAAHTAHRVASLRAALTAEGWESFGEEPWKLTLCPKSRSYTGAEVAALLARQNIYCEFADPDFIVFLFTPRLPARAYDALRTALCAIPLRDARTEGSPALGIPKRVLSPREAMLALTETVPTDQALGRVLADPCVSCPPAVPILLCGEEIDKAALAAFRYYGIERVTVTSASQSARLPDDCSAVHENDKK